MRRQPRDAQHRPLSALTEPNMYGLSRHDILEPALGRGACVNYSKSLELDFVEMLVMQGGLMGDGIVDTALVEGLLYTLN